MIIIFLHLTMFWFLKKFKFEISLLIRALLSLINKIYIASEVGFKCILKPPVGKSLLLR